MGLHIDYVYVLWRERAHGEFVGVFLTIDAAKRHAFEYIYPHDHSTPAPEWVFLEGQVTRYPQWVDEHGFFITKVKLGD